MDFANSWKSEWVFIDVMEQILSEIKVSPALSFWLDESTDVSSCSQLLVFVRYIYLEYIKEECLFCRAWKTTTKSQDVMEMISSFLESNDFNEKTCVGCVPVEHQPYLDRGRDVSQKWKSLHPKHDALHNSPICPCYQDSSKAFVRSARLVGDNCQLFKI